jgi:hypothetical protein
MFDTFNEILGKLARDEVITGYGNMETNFPQCYQTPA